MNCIPAAAAEAAEETEAEGPVAPADVAHEVAEELELCRLDGADDVLREADDLQEAVVNFSGLKLTNNGDHEHGILQVLKRDGLGFSPHVHGTWESYFSPSLYS